LGKIREAIRGFESGGGKAIRILARIFTLDDINILSFL
jgi:hypothetical protein